VDGRHITRTKGTDMKHAVISILFATAGFAAAPVFAQSADTGMSMSRNQVQAQLVQAERDGVLSAQDYANYPSHTIAALQASPTSNVAIDGSSVGASTYGSSSSSVRSNPIIDETYRGH
jgi:hypothetical protein